MKVQDLIRKWEKKMADAIKAAEKEKNITNRLIHLSAHTSISDMLIDVKKLNLLHEELKK